MNPILSSPPRIAAIHDLSCFGRCALTVVMPTLSVMGYQVVPIPTALLSTHTGGFDNLHFRDLTDDMEQIAAHFARLGVTFRAIYTGFLGSTAQIDTVNRFLDRFGNQPDESGEAPLVLVDPVMGDDGALYSTYTKPLADGMRSLAARARYVTPNLTEACYLAGIPYRDTSVMTETALESYLGEILAALEQPGRDAVVTGVRTKSREVANFGRMADGQTFCVRNPLCEKLYPGTGDLFASLLLGDLLRGKSFPDACRFAADKTAAIMHASAPLDTPLRNGVALEPMLKDL